jgi:hypothetical protein
VAILKVKSIEAGYGVGVLRNCKLPRMRISSVKLNTDPCLLLFMTSEPTFKFHRAFSSCILCLPRERLAIKKKKIK